MGIISRLPVSNQKQKHSISYRDLIIGFALGWLGLLILIGIIKSINKPPLGSSWVKEKSTGLVTVLDSKNHIICRFYDSTPVRFGGIGVSIVDTILIHNSNDTLKASDFRD